MADTEIKIIKGDSVNVTVKFRNIDLNSIAHVYFSSRNLPTHELVFEAATETTEDLYRLIIDAAETVTYPIGLTSYDITVQFLNDTVQTVRYQGPMRVFDKTNRVDV